MSTTLMIENDSHHIDAIRRPTTAGPFPVAARRRCAGRYDARLACTAAAKHGLPPAQGAALHRLAIYRPLQRQLPVSDNVLCRLIEGDCAARTAGIQRMKRVALGALARRARLGPRGARCSARR